MTIMLKVLMLSLSSFPLIFMNDGIGWRHLNFFGLVFFCIKIDVIYVLTSHAAIVLDMGQFAVKYSQADLRYEPKFNLNNCCHFQKFKEGSTLSTNRLHKPLMLQMLFMPWLHVVMH